MEKIEIQSDALGIVSRIVAWNKNYRVYFNLKNKKYMLYLIENIFKPPVYCLTFPYDKLDELMIDYTLLSEVQNREKYLKEIEESNARLLKAEQNRVLKKAKNDLLL